MRRFMKVFAFLMLGLGLVAAPGYWTFVNFLSASTLTEQVVFDSENTGNQTAASGGMTVYLTPRMNPLQILGRLDIAPSSGSSAGSNPNLNVVVLSGGQQVWAATAAVPVNFNAASGGGQPPTVTTAINVNLGTLYVFTPGDYLIRGNMDGENIAQFQRLSLEVRRDVIGIRWGIFGVGILLILGAVILYRVVES